MKTAVYRQPSGASLIVDYDENAPCLGCGLPVVEASMSGTAVCPWCDTGRCRFSPCGRVDTEFDHDTGKIMSPKKHYEKYHADQMSGLKHV